MSDFVRLYRGQIYEIWLTRQESGCQVKEFVNGLDEATYRKMRSVVTRTADEGKYTNIEIYRHVGDGVYEFKARTARIYSFDDGRRIVLTHGDKKRGTKAVAERERARRIRVEYLAWKGRQK